MYLDLARELRKLRNISVMVIQFVIVLLKLFPTAWELEELEIGGRMDTIQTATLLRSARNTENVLETCGDLHSLIL